jgi:hypothetical protein
MTPKRVSGLLMTDGTMSGLAAVLNNRGVRTSRRAVARLQATTSSTACRRYVLAYEEGRPWEAMRTG